MYRVVTDIDDNQKSVTAEDALKKGREKAESDESATVSVWDEHGLMWIRFGDKTGEL